MAIDPLWYRVPHHSAWQDCPAYWWRWLRTGPGQWCSHSWCTPDCSCHGLVQEQVPLLSQKSQEPGCINESSRTFKGSWGGGHQLVFSTDPNLSKSKTKCILFCGRVNSVEYPAPVLLDGKELPWVQSAGHLGHTHCTRWLPWTWTARSGEPSLSTGQLK